MHWYLEVLKKYANFGGRAQRKEYWMFTLVHTIIIVVFTAIEFALYGVDTEKLLFTTVYQWATLLPSSAVGVRRLHDTDHSGWWLLVPLFNLVLMARESQEGDNSFGPNPKESNDE